MLVQVAMPYLAYSSWQVEALDKSSTLVNPLTSPDQDGISIKEIGNFPAFYSNRESRSAYDHFYISIPKIGLTKQKVLASSNDFEATPASLPGTALPGEKGNVFITGHSSLPQFATGNAKATFSKLPGIKKGDEVLVQAGGLNLTYVVISLRVVDPTEVSVISPPDTIGRYLTLMTCVPPGFNTKRLIVLTKLKG